MKVETIVSADLSSMGNASSHPVRWSIIVRMCLFPEVHVSPSIMKLIAILSNGLSGISVICSGEAWTLAFSLWHRAQLAMYFLMSLFIPFQ